MRKTTQVHLLMNKRPTGFLVVAFLLLLFQGYAQSVTPWLTTGDQSKLIEKQNTISFSNTTGSSDATITVDEFTTYQTIDGFGYTLTEGSAELIMAMDSSAQNALLNDIFNPNTGLNINIVRIGIGATDLSSSSYSYNETAGDVNMNDFSLDGPDQTYLIPVIKKILLINPNAKILATPWSAPRWMKTVNSWSGGRLQTQYYAAYAKYFVKYFDAMKDHGIEMWGITPQNEPENNHNDPSMLMNSTEQKNFINSELGPQMVAAGYGGIKIIAFDHNCDNISYPIDVLNNSSYVDGAAFHLYGGDISAMTTVYEQTNKNVYFTEQYTGPGDNFSGDFAWHMKNVVTGSINNWSKTVLEWNLAIDENLNPHTPGGCTTCLGAVTITGNNYTKNVAYYILGQISQFVKSGAVRAKTTSSNANLVTSGFRNPDGSIALLVHNQSAASISLKVNKGGSSAFTFDIPGLSAVTFTWGAGANVDVTDVVLDTDLVNLSTNGNSQLFATVLPSNASNQNVTWTSSDTSVVTVNSNGVLTGVSEGNAIITVKTQDGNKTATANVVVSNVLVTGISVSPSSSSLFVSDTQQLSTVFTPSNASNKSVSWSSNNTAVATVDNSGLVTAVGAGTATITVTSVDGLKTDEATIIVNGQLPYNGTPALIPGVIQAENYDLGGPNLAYFDADESNNGGAYRTNESVDISTISGASDYTVGWAADGEWLEYTTNVTAGTYTIEASLASPNSGKQLKILLDGVSLTTISVPNTGSWNSFEKVSIPNISVSGGDGKIIRFEIIGGDFNIDKIEFVSAVFVPVSSVTLNPSNSELSVGSSSQLTAEVLPNNASNKSVIYSSSNTGVATINANGLVYAVSEGTTTITVTTEEGSKTAFSTVTVTAASTEVFPGFYNIISRNSNKGLDIANNATHSGATIQQYEINNGGGANQRWRFESAGNGDFYIISKATQMYLATENNGTGNGVNVVQRSFVNSDEFKWTLTPVSGGYFKIINLNSGKALDVEGVSTANGANIHVWTYAEGLNQQWELVQVESSTAKSALSKKENTHSEDISYLIYQDYGMLKISRNNSGYAKLGLYTISGAQVLQENLNFTANSLSEISISHLSSGIYIIRLEDEEGITTKKFVK